MNNNEDYIIVRDIIHGENKFKEGKYICNREDGCHIDIAKLEINNKKNEHLINTCQLKCVNNKDCQACHYNKESQECLCYNVDQELLLEREFNKVTTNALRISSNSGFGKNKRRNNSLLKEEELDPSSCGCGN